MKKNNNYPSCTYRVSAKAIIMQGGKLLLIKEKGNKWDLPGGGVEHLEAIEEALRRELKEELGIFPSKIEKDKLLAWTTYDFDEGWEKPILYLLYRAQISKKPVDTSEVKVKWFEKQEIENIEFEKHINKFKNDLIQNLFNPTIIS